MGSEESAAILYPEWKGSCQASSIQWHGKTKLAGVDITYQEMEMTLSLMFLIICKIHNITKNTLLKTQHYAKIFTLEKFGSFAPYDLLIGQKALSFEAKFSTHLQGLGYFYWTVECWSQCFTAHLRWWDWLCHLVNPASFKPVFNKHTLMLTVVDSISKIPTCLCPAWCSFFENM